MPDEKRETERLDILGELPGAAAVVQPVTIKQLSRGGALLETAVPLQPNSLHEFRLALGERSVIVKGRVAHCRVSDVDQEHVRYRAGIEFVELPPATADAIGAFIEDLKAGRRGN
jgi:PilZ domain